MVRSSLLRIRRDHTRGHGRIKAWQGSKRGKEASGYGFRVDASKERVFF